MGRVMYVHHYFPALYFGVISLAYTTDFYAKKATPIMGTLLRLAVGVACIACFIYFSDFAFGMNKPASLYSGRKWLSSWNIT